MRATVVSRVLLLNISLRKDAARKEVKVDLFFFNKCKPTSLFPQRPALFFFLFFLFFCCCIFWHITALDFKLKNIKKNKQKKIAKQTTITTKEKKTSCQSFNHRVFFRMFLCLLQNLYAPDPDPELEVVHYERTKEQDDELGILDMKTEGYEQDS